MFEPTKGPARELVDGDELRELERTGSIVIDERRRRPLYFDGRFLAARDLTREQNYFLGRQVDVARAVGDGVVYGLWVREGSTPTSLRIMKGHGFTVSGESVILPRDLDVDLAALATMQRLDRAFGLLEQPRTPARNRTGVFVLGLRPVEFTANPIASYPDSVTADRSVEDGDIIEGVVATLIPYPDDGSREELDERRAHIARRIFIEGAHLTRAVIPGGLPLALIGLDSGVVRWVDPFLVRRDVGAEQRDIVGLGVARRPLREAFLWQYSAHLRDVLQQRDASGGRRFAASEHFLALPPAGPMPAAAIDPNDFTQMYFPPEVDVELSIVPDDEIGVLLEESLLYPHIDLTLSGEDLESTSVVVLIPVERQRLRRLKTTLATLTRALLPAAPGLVAKRKPLDALRSLTRARVALPRVSPQAIADGAWREVFAAEDMLWYVRRRNVHTKTEVVGSAVPAAGDEFAAEEQLMARLGELELTGAFNALDARASAGAYAEIVSLLTGRPFLEGSPILIEGAIRELEALETLDADSVLRVAERFNRAGIGEGLARLAETSSHFSDDAAVMTALARSGAVPELDRLASLTTSDLEPIAEELLRLVHEEPENIRQFVQVELRRLVVRSPLVPGDRTVPFGPRDAIDAPALPGDR